VIWRALQFDFPSAAWLLFFVILIAVSFYHLHHYRQRQLQEFATQSILDVILEKRDPMAYWIKAFLFSLAWIFAVIALMQPKGNERYVSSLKDGQIVVSKKTPEKAIMRKKAHEVIFLIDASASMKIADNFDKTRLEISKEIVDDVIRHLQGENVSLYAFTSATIQMVPSTLDYLFTRLILQQIAINEGETEGTNIQQALEFLRKRYFEKPSSKTKTLIVLTDGGDTRLEGLNGEQRKQAIAEIVNPVADSADHELRVFVVGLGELQGKKVPGMIYKGQSVLSVLEEPLLRKLSVIGRGELYLAKDMASLQISQAISRQISRRGSFVDTSMTALPIDAGVETRVYDYYFQIPLTLAILALMGYIFIPDTRHKERMKGKSE
jgi:Ca-activated chloride channel family protein